MGLQIRQTASKRALPRNSHNAQRGVTLQELLVVISIVVTLAIASTTLFRDFIPRQSLIGRANNLVGLIYHAREQAVGSGPVLLCAMDTLCDDFDHANGLILISDDNDNFSKDSNEKILREFRLPDGMTMQWRSFRGKPWLRFDSDARSWYQNGHYLLCMKNYGLKVIVTRIGRPRVAKGGVSTTLCNV